MTSSLAADGPTDLAPPLPHGGEPGDGNGPPSPPATGRRRPPRVVLVATAAFTLLCGLWSVLTPLAEAPDEPAHLGLVLHVADTGSYPAHDGLVHTAGIFRFCGTYATSAKWCRTRAEREAGIDDRDRPADAAPPRSERQHWDDPDFARPVPTRLNQLPQHPPLYYQVMGVALRVERAVLGPATVDRELAFLRLLNVLLVAPLPWLAWGLVRRLGGDDELGTVAALLPLGIPQLTHIGATLNNDNLFVLLGSILMVLVAGVVAGDRSSRTAALVGLTLGLALLTKGFGIVLPAAVALAYWAGSTRSDGGRSPGRRWNRLGSSAPPLAVAAAVAGVVGGWWYAANLAATGHIMPSIEDAKLNARYRPPDFQPELGKYFGTLVTRLVEGSWGAFGWRRVELPTAVSAVATIVCLAAVVAVLRRRPALATGAGRLPRGHAAVLLTPVVLLTAFVAIRSAVIYRETGRLAFQQGRYLFAGLTAMGAVVALGLRAWLGRRTTTVVLAAVVAMQALGVGCGLVGWWGAGDRGVLAALRAVVAWAGWPPAVTIATLVTGPAAMAVLVLRVRSDARSDARAVDAGTVDAVGQSPT